MLRALLTKEVRRHLANRGGLALAALLVVAALLLSVFNPTLPGATPPPGAAPPPVNQDGEAGGLVAGVHHCFIDDIQATPVTRAIVSHLRKNIPPELKPRIEFRRRNPGIRDEWITYPAGTGAIQLRSSTDPTTGRETVLFDIWYPPGDPGGMWPYEQWFWAESLQALGELAKRSGVEPTGFTPPNFADDLWVVRDAYNRLNQAATTAAAARSSNPNAISPLPLIDIRRQGLGGQPLHLRDAVATAMVIFALYFTCVYLLPTLTCEERERGVLLAQALSPASPAEILAAKFLFYPMLGIGLAALIAGIYRPTVLLVPFFWLSLLAVSGGFLGIGMTVASLAKTQRAAFLGAMCYLLSVALLLLICQQNGIPFLPYLALEFHGPRIIHAAVTGNIQPMYWVNLLFAGGLAVMWVTIAGWLFRRRGWQ